MNLSACCRTHRAVPTTVDKAKELKNQISFFKQCELVERRMFCDDGSEVSQFPRTHFPQSKCHSKDYLFILIYLRTRKKTLMLMK